MSAYETLGSAPEDLRLRGSEHVEGADMESGWPDEIVSGS